MIRPTVPPQPSSGHVHYDEWVPISPPGSFDVYMWCGCEVRDVIAFAGYALTRGRLIMEAVSWAGFYDPDAVDLHPALSVRDVRMVGAA